MIPEDLPPERGRQVDAAFRQALELEPAEQATYLRRIGVEDPELAGWVASLLQAVDEAEDFLSDADGLLAPDLLGELAGESDSLAPGRRIGRYRLLHEIGRGGTGVVYVAERADEEFEQRVALKVLRRGLDTDDVLRRFRAERQILASLDHPNIARLYDGGALDDGRPYLVMEHVAGVPITEFCDARRLGVDERLRLFLMVCDAVRYAHRNLIVHRDLKPSNILVTDDGQVKLLDFGIAKLLSPAPPTTPPTRTGQRWLTPEYASPEQVRGGRITTASDVYQLGVLLYVLLSGHHPYPLRHESPAAIEQMICERSPTRPSSAVVRSAASAPAACSAAGIAERRRTEPRRLRGRLRGDLDTIVLTALQKEPERRYGTVTELADDIGRHLTGHPVAARRDGWSYRAAKLVRRRPALLGGGLALLLAAAGYTLTLRAHAEQLEQERNLARAEREQADLARQRADAERERAVAERDRAEAAGVRAGDAQRDAEHERDRALLAERAAALASVEARIEALKTDRVSHFLIGLFEASNPSVERLDTLTSRALLARGVERVGPDLQDHPEVRAALLGTIGRVHSNLGLFDQAGPLLEEALAIRRGLHRAHHPAVVASVDHLADNFSRNLAHAKAEPLYREAVATRRDLRSADPLPLATSLAGLARTLRDLGRADSAEILMRESLALRRRVQPDTHPEVVAALADLAFVLRGKNDFDGAEALYREVLAKQRANQNTQPLELAATQNNLAYLLRVRGDHAAAEALYRDALAANLALLGEAHRTTATMAGNLAAVLALQGRRQEAEALLRERVEVERRHQPENHWRIGAALGGLAVFLTQQDDHVAAEDLLRDQIAIYTAGLGADHAWTASAWARLGLNLVAQLRFAEAEALLLAARDSLAAAPETPQRLEAKGELARALARLYELRSEHEGALR
jgi:eukaryotic-like serine/threonine-protein kinase